MKFQEIKQQFNKDYVTKKIQDLTNS